MEPSKKKLKSAEVNKKIKQIVESNRVNNRERPQDVYKPIQCRVRQNNLNMTSFSFPANRPPYWEPLGSMFSSKQSWDCYSPGTKFRWIRTPKDLVKLSRLLESCDEFAVDTEANCYDSRLGYICIMQISTWEYGDFLIGALKLHNEISQHLKSVLENPNILKIFHGCSNDVRWIQRDFDIFLNGVADTQEFAFEYKGVTNIAYKDLCHKVLRKYDYLLEDETISDWSLRPETGITKKQEDYAIHDVHLLLRIFDKLRYLMRDDLMKMEQAFVNSNAKTKVLFDPPKNQVMEVTVVAEKMLKFLEGKGVKCKNGLSPQFISHSQYHKLVGIVEWRNVFARLVDKQDNGLLSPFKIFRLVELQSPSMQDINNIVGDLGIVAGHQKSIILNILKSQNVEEYMAHLKSVECHNCLSTGHGCAIFCPFPANPSNYFTWLLRLENEASLKKRYITNDRFNVKHGYPHRTFLEFVSYCQRKARNNYTN